MSRGLREPTAYRKRLPIGADRLQEPVSSFVTLRESMVAQSREAVQESRRQGLSLRSPSAGDQLGPVRLCAPVRCYHGACEGGSNPTDDKGRKACHSKPSRSCSLSSSRRLRSRPKAGGLPSPAEPPPTFTTWCWSDSMRSRWEMPAPSSAAPMAGSPGPRRRAGRALIWCP